MFKKTKKTEKSNKEEKKKERKDEEPRLPVSSAVEASEKVAPPSEPKVVPPPKTADVAKEEEERKKREKDEIDRKIREEEDKRKKEEDKQRELERIRLEEQRKKERQEEKKAKKQRKKEEDRRAEEDEGAERELLNSISVSPADVKKDYHLFPREVCLAYEQLQVFSRQLNTPIPAPEIVFIGFQSQGKSSVFEAILGIPFTVVGYDGATRRPLYLNLMNSTETRITIKRDPLTNNDHDVIAIPGTTDLAREIQQRNSIFSLEPIFINYESTDTLNITLIDTPGLISTKEEGLKGSDLLPKANEIRTFVENMAKIPTRIIVCVEECKDWDSVEMTEWIKGIDPEHARTIFVYTKFHSYAQRFNSTRDINKYFAGTSPDVKTFFVSMFSSKTRSASLDLDKYQEKILQAQKRDESLLEQLQYDKKYENNIGVHAFRRYLLHMTWKNFHEGVPLIYRRLQTKKSSTEDQVKKLEDMLMGLDVNKHRTLASAYVVEFLQIIERLLAGTSEGNPAVWGQSLEEEKSSCTGNGEWIDAQNRLLRIEDVAKITYADNKLYGGQQFERLLAEFKAIAESIKCTDPSPDEVATAAGVNKINNIPNHAYAACDLASQKTQEAFIPLIEQTCSRAVYIMKRLPDIASGIMENRKRSQTSSLFNNELNNVFDNIIMDASVSSLNTTSGNIFDVDRIQQYPYFTFHVKDLYCKFVEQTAKNCRDKCLDEFYNTRTIYWDFTETTEKGILFGGSENEIRRGVSELTVHLFKNLQDRIMRHCLFKLYNFFLVPIQTQLWAVVQGSITSLSDDKLAMIFEAEATKKRIREEQKALKLIIDQCSSQETLLNTASDNYSHKLIVSGFAT